MYITATLWCLIQATCEFSLANLALEKACHYCASFVPTYLPSSTYLPTYLPSSTYLPTYLPTYLDENLISAPLKCSRNSGQKALEYCYLPCPPSLEEVRIEWHQESSPSAGMSQCDQIGPFLNSCGDKFNCKSSPNITATIWLFWKTSLFRWKNCCGCLGSLLENIWPLLF